MKQIVIIGGGASGLMAGIHAARAGASVTILEKCEKPGKKLLATGNGRCNLTNQKMDFSCYHGDADLIRSVLQTWSYDDTIRFFRDLGLWTKSRDGWIYPRTDQAASVLNLLLQEFRRLKGKMKTRETVTAIKKQGDRFTVFTEGWHYEADAVILASGTPASNIEGVSSAALKLADSFGIASREFRPSLVSLKCVRENRFAKWAGIRCQAELKLICGGQTVQTEAGELQLTDYGISGIPVFQLSSAAGELLEKGKHPLVEINFLPDLNLQKLEEELNILSERDPSKSAGELLTGILPDRLIAAFTGDSAQDNKKSKKKKKSSDAGSSRLKYSIDTETGEKSIDGRVGTRTTQYSQNNQTVRSAVHEILATASCCRVTVSSLGPLKQAQICAGGILASELSEHMETKKVPGLYVTGECINTDGRCGGYNLQWAWSTGAIAGRSAAEILE